MKLSRSRLLTDPGRGGGAQLHETGSRHRSNRQAMESVGEEWRKRELKGMGWWKVERFEGFIIIFVVTREGESKSC